MVKTCEFVSPKHPDKICDFIADLILDAYLAKEPTSRVAAEVMGGHKLVTVNGEITSHAHIDIEKLIKKIVGREYKVIVNIAKQSPYIAQGVDIGGAGDQGIMMGYAFRGTKNFMPLEYELARTLCQKIYRRYPNDGKVQVTTDGKKILAVVASFQNSKTKDLEKFTRSTLKADEYLINTTGEWTLGGFDADSGLSGRKIVIDNYGPEHGVGGGSFSGKDPTKVDRSGAYMARRIAVRYLAKFKANYVKVKLAYAIGKAEAVMAVAEVDGKSIELDGFDVRPRTIINELKLRRPIYANISQWGHFGRGFTWDR